MRKANEEGEREGGKAAVPLKKVYNGNFKSRVKKPSQFMVAMKLNEVAFCDASLPWDSRLCSY